MKNTVIRYLSLSLIFILCVSFLSSYNLKDVRADEITDLTEQVQEVADEVSQTTDEATVTAEQAASVEVEEEVLVEEEPEYRYVAVDSMKVYKKADSESKLLGKIKWKKKVTFIKETKKWSKITYEDMTGYVLSSNLTEKRPVVTKKDPYVRYVTKKTTIRKTPSSASTSGGSYEKGKKLTCYGTSGNWTLIKKSDKQYFIPTKNLSKNKPKATGKDVVNYAKKFVGNKYKYGGTSLTNGTDCSGFTQSVYKHFGYKIPRTSSEQRSAGKSVKFANRKAGDIICYSGHVAIYIGDNKIVHASNSKPYPQGGIKISSVYIKDIKSVRRIIK